MNTAATPTPPAERPRLPHDGDFPQRLRAKRLRKGWSQVDLALAAGMTPAGFRTIQDWELGKVTPRPGGHILKVAEALGVTVEWLLWGEEEA